MACHGQWSILLRQMYPPIIRFLRLHITKLIRYLCNQRHYLFCQNSFLAKLNSYFSHFFCETFLGETFFWRNFFFVFSKTLIGVASLGVDWPCQSFPFCQVLHWLHYIFQRLDTHKNKHTLVQLYYRLFWAFL